MNTLDKAKQKKSRRTLILVLLTFGLPIILAKLALEQNWLDYGVTNQGTLMNEEITLTELGLEAVPFPQQWLILYALPSSCQLHCQQTLESVHNSYVALGREMPRVTPVALVQNQLSVEQNQRIEQSQWQLLSMPSVAKQKINQGSVFVVDPLGNIILQHVPPTQENDLPAFGKQILADMKKLLKYSRVG
ncbi:hypothetical protein [Thalassotalea sp. PLHSN55]|uniref:hypothetical protein n=1 Tax=Thalassotalea sp. PLHSN55 TaxID=3435888 RepID=UPI003F8375A1